MRYEVIGCLPCQGEGRERGGEGKEKKEGLTDYMKGEGKSGDDVSVANFLKCSIRT